MTQPTLPERLMSEARVKYVRHSPEAGDYMDSFEAIDLDQIILHTIEQTIKEGCSLLERKGVLDLFPDHVIRPDIDTAEKVMFKEGYNQGITDSQHALGGIMK